MRVSNYEVFIHLEPEEKTLLFNGLYGSMDIVSLRLGAILEKVSNEKQTMTHFDFMDFDTEKVLADRKHLTLLSPEEELNLCRRAINSFENMQKPFDQAGKFTILLTYDCNFRCPYCYEHTENREYTMLSAKRIIEKSQIDTIFKIINSYPYMKEKSQIELFGGEPLFSRTLPVVPYIVERSLEVNRTVAATTNGYELDLFEKWLGPNMISDLIITIDGPKDVHNKRRILANGKNTFDKIIDNILIALSRETDVRVRVNLDRTNIGRYEEIVRFFIDNGFYDNEHFSMGFALIKSFPGIKNDLALLEKEALDYLEQTIKDKDILKIGIAEIGGNTLDHLRDRSSIATSKTRYCGAAGSGLFFAPDGLLFTCNEAVGEKQYSIGYYDEMGLHIDAEKERLWRERRVTNMTDCQVCPLVLICAGGCPYRAIASGEPTKPYCDNEKEVFSSRLKTQIRMANLLA